MKAKRNDQDPPTATGEWGWRYHHIGIPTKDPIGNEKYMSEFKMYTGGFATSPFGIEWMRFESGSPVQDLVKSVPHVAFEVDNIDEEITKHSLNVLTPPNNPAEGIRVAMIEHNGAPVELIEFN